MLIRVILAQTVSFQSQRYFMSYNVIIYSVLIYNEIMRSRTQYLADSTNNTERADDIGSAPRVLRGPASLVALTAYWRAVLTAPTVPAVLAIQAAPVAPGVLKALTIKGTTSSVEEANSSSASAMVKERLYNSFNMDRLTVMGGSFLLRWW